ncbi:hypothetical protein AHAS_Ahas19G0135300 [Arachis hypogaea]
MVEVHGNSPQAIITDQCKSMFGTIRNVLPDTRHRWCIWHIMNKIPHKIERYSWYREIDVRMHDTIWNARSVESFKNDWCAFIDEFNLEQNRWLSDLYDDCRMAKLFDYHANLGLRSVPTTQKSMVKQHDPALGSSDIQGPSMVAMKGQPRLKRLGSKLDTCIKKSLRRKKKNPPPVCKV